MNFEIWHIWFILISYVHVIDCCRFGSRPNCGFPCRCSDSNLCDSETGECAPGSQCQSVLPNGYGWGGPGCLIGNVAYNKSNAWQSGQYLHYSAKFAVDGDTRPYVTNAINESCAYPTSGVTSQAWWWIKLGGLYNIQSIIIVNRLAAPGTAQPQLKFDERSTNYDIKIGNTSYRSTQTLCFHQDKTGRNIRPVETMMCNQGDMTGRYVSFTRIGGRDPDQATICEFIVMGHPVIDCSPDNCNGNCDIVIGCDECKPGKMLPDCWQDCPDGYWGVNCANLCGMCNNGNVCDKITGSCGEQCDGWYLPDMCTSILGNPPTILWLTVKDVTEKSAMINWDRSGGYSEYFYFVARYGIKASNVNKWFVSEKIYITDAIAISFQYPLSNLVYNTIYGVQITAYRELSNMTHAGDNKTVSFKSRCIAPNKPSPLSVIGSPDLFKVFWKPGRPSGSGCDHLEKLQVSVKCQYSTHTTNRTTDLPPTATEFLYSAVNASLCTIWLILTNNEGLSTEDDKVTVWMKTTTDPLITSEQTPPQSSATSESQINEALNGPEGDSLNIPAIAVGAVSGALILGLLFAVILLVLRLRNTHRTTLEDISSPRKSRCGDGKSNPVYENVYGAENKQTNKEYETVDDVKREAQQSGAKESNPRSDPTIYENSNTSQYETMTQGQRGTANTTLPVYQELM